MARTLTAQETQVYAGTDMSVRMRVQIKDAGGSFVDYTTLEGENWVDEAEIDRHVDQPVATATITLRRDVFALSLSPLVQASKINNPAGSFAARIDVGREVKIETAVLPLGQEAVSGDWRLEFHGEIDEYDMSADDRQAPIRLTCRDLGCRLLDRMLEKDGTAAGAAYSPSNNQLLETVCQAIVDDWGPGGVTVNLVGASPGWVLNAYTPPKQSVLDAIRDLAAMIGWDVRYRYHEASTSYRLELFQPDRSKSSPDITLAASQYFAVGRMGISRADVRNVVRVSYYKTDGTPGTPVTASDATSISKYGRRFCEIAEASTSAINTGTEAALLAAAVLADLKDPIATTERECIFLYHAELGDLVRFSADGLLSDQNQDISVVGIRHVLSKDGSAKTFLTCAGKPKGAMKKWWEIILASQKDYIRDVSPPAPTLTATAKIQGVTLELTANMPAGPLVDYVEWHLSTTNGFTPDATTLKKKTRGNAVEILGLTQGTTYYAKARIVTMRGLNSSYSSQATFTPGLVLAADIGALDYIQIKDVDGTPVADRRIRVIDGVFQFANTSNVETAGVVRVADPIIKDTDGSPVEDLTLKNLGGLFRPFSGATERAFRVKGFKAAQPAAFVAPNGDGIPLAFAFDRGTTNHIKNPRWKTGTANWASSGSVTTYTRDTGRFVWGDASGKIVTFGFGGIISDYAAAAPSEQWIASVYVSGDVGFKIKLRFLDSGGGLLRTDASATFTPGANFSSSPENDRYKMKVVGSSPASTARVEVYIETQAAGTIYVSGAQLEKLSNPTVYCDGSLGDGHSWSGTADASSSTREPGLHIYGAIDTAVGRPVFLREDGTLDVQYLLNVGTPDGYVQALVGGSGGFLDVLGYDTAVKDFVIRPRAGGYFGVTRKSSGFACFRATSTAGQTIETGAGETVIFGTEATDLGADYNPTTGIFTAPEDGIYEFVAGAGIASLADAKMFQISIRVNGTGVATNTTMGNGTNTVAVEAASGPLSLASGDQVLVHAVNADTASRNLTTSVGYTFFGGRRVA